MTKVSFKSFVSGFITGAVLLATAPLGLGIAFVEFLKPILAPAVGMLRTLSPNISAPFLWLFAFLLNGLVYALLFFSIVLIRKNISGRKKKTALILMLILAFLALTGMLGNLYDFLKSPDKSWIFETGA